jgi:hypothetical protein
MDKFNLDLNWLDLFLSLVLPMLVALVTARVAHPGLKATVLGLLAAVTAVVQGLIDVGGHLSAVDWSGTFSGAVWIFLVAVGLHFGLLNPAGLTGSTGAIQNAVPGGLGNARYVEPESRNRGL